MLVCSQSTGSLKSCLPKDFGGISRGIVLRTPINKMTCYGEIYHWYNDAFPNVTIRGVFNKTPRGRPTRLGTRTVFGTVAPSSTSPRKGSFAYEFTNLPEPSEPRLNALHTSVNYRRLFFLRMGLELLGTREGNSVNEIKQNPDQGLNKTYT